MAYIVFQCAIMNNIIVIEINVMPAFLFFPFVKNNESDMESISRKSQSTYFVGIDEMEKPFLKSETINA